MKYDYQSLDALRNECILKVANGSGDAYTAQIGMAASYALDLIDICKDNNVTLALNMATEENVLRCMERLRHSTTLPVPRMEN